VSHPHSRYDHVGLKAERAQQQLDRVRGVGRYGYVVVEVDAANRLVALNVPGAQEIIQAYLMAVRDVRPRVESAVREYLQDPDVAVMSTFHEATAGLPAPTVQQPPVGPAPVQHTPRQQPHQSHEPPDEGFGQPKTWRPKW